MKTRSTTAQDSDLVQFRNEIGQFQADLIARDEHYRSIHEEIRRKQDEQYDALVKNIQDWQRGHNRRINMMYLLVPSVNVRL
jgi:hypothetical protein